MHKLIKIFLLIFFMGICLFGQAQQKTIVIVKDNKTPFINQLELTLKEELNNVLMARYTLDFTTISGDNERMRISNEFNAIYSEKKVDLVIALGMVSSQILHQRRAYSIPSIATMVLEDSSISKSNTLNYTYTSPFKSIPQIVDYFAKMYRLSTIGIAVDGGFKDDTIVALKDTTVSLKMLTIGDDEIEENVEGILILPQFFYSDEDIQLYIQRANERQIPTFSINDAYISFDVTAAIASGELIIPIIKKTALNSLYIFEGTNASELEIKQNTQPLKLVLNMEGIRTIEKLPEWQYFENATLVNVAKGYNEEALTLPNAIALGLKEKLSLKKSVVSVNISAQDVKQAKGNLTPNLSLGAQSVWLSNNLVEASLGQKGATTISGSLDLLQVLFSEPVLANVTIKKLLQENAIEQNLQEILDGVVSITQAYISALLAKSNLTLQNENLNKTKTNLAIAESKEKLGVGQQSDVSRWISELNVNKIQLSSAQANYKKTVYTLNETLNQSISKMYAFPDSLDIQEIFKFPEALLSPYLKDEFLTETLADFYLQEMRSYAPELQQILLSEQIAERRIQSSLRQFYLPELVGFASANDIFLLNGVVTNPQLPVPPPPEDLTWFAGIGLRFPLLNNQTRKTNLEKSKLDSEMLSYSKRELINALEKSIRSQVQQFKASFLSYNFAIKASSAADKNYMQAEDAYQEGFITVTQLLEAQTAKFNANLLVMQTNYKMVLDYLLLERQTGKIQLLASEQEQNEYLNRLKENLLK